MDHPSLNQLKSAVLGPTVRIGEVIVDAPRLANVVAGLETDRREILAAFDALHVDKAKQDDLVHRLTAYRQRAADLLHQAYSVDLGGET